MLAFPRCEPGAGQRRLIPRDGLLLGRGARVFEQPFDDPHMADAHAEVRLENGSAVLQPLEGRGRTWVNARQLSGPRVLETGDVIRLGDTLLVSAPWAPSLSSEPELVGESRSMVEVRRSIEAVAAHSCSVIVSGETGTGKEVVARLLHRRSGLRGPFVAVNCGAFTDGLLASELFGHERGAFTGAVGREPGVFRAASGGSLLLDEIADMPLPMQTALLRVLETRRVRPVGSAREVPVEVRVIATCSSDPVDLVRAGALRSDLYSRLAQWSIRLPSLREHRDDIGALCRHLLARCGGAGCSLSPDLTETLLLHDWPLNVRGLLNALAVAVISSPSPGRLSLTREVRAALESTAPLAGVSPGQVDKMGLEELLGRFHGKVAHAARHLGVTRPKLYRLLWAHGIEPEKFRG